MKCLTLIILFFSASQLLAGTNYYVSTIGSDSNDGLSISTAFKNISYASNIANHGDTINVLSGTYSNPSYGVWDIWKDEETVKINNKNATSGDYLIIRAYNNDKVKLKGDGGFIFQIRNSSYIKVIGFEIEGEVDNIPLDSALKYQFVYRQCLNQSCTNFQDTFRVAFGSTPEQVEAMEFEVLKNVLRPTTINNIGLLVQNSHHIEVLNNLIHHNTGTGIRFFKCDYINCIGNEVHNNSRRASIGNHGLVFHSSTSIDNSSDFKIIIAQNKVHNNYNEVYSWSENKTFITPIIDEGKGISMQKNTKENGWKNGKIKIENNLAHHNGFSGIHVNSGIRIDIINNTAFNNSLTFKGQGGNIGISVQEGEDVGVYNNISVAHTDGFALSASNPKNVIFSNNLVDGNLDNDVDNLDENTIFSSAEFADTILYKLRSTSLAINTSINTLAPNIDYYGKIRDENPDRGAVEFITASSINDMFNDKLNFYPNPTNGITFIKTSDNDKIEVLTLTGKNVTNQTSTSNYNNIITLNLSKLGAGTYILKLGNKTEQIVIN